MVEDVLKTRLPTNQVGQLYRVSAPTVRKWVAPYLAEGKAGLTDTGRARIPLREAGIHSCGLRTGARRIAMPELTGAV